jgi:peptidoglycan/xylan/chitin deacetylase (PgdA/CDA1 family)
MRFEHLAVYIGSRRPVVSLVERVARSSIPSQGKRGLSAVGLTFDDGPHPVWTPRILDELDTGSAKATFFVVGRRAKEHASVVRDARARGHDVGIHLYSHDRRTVYDDASFDEEIRRSRDELGEILGESIRFLRFPYGERGRQDPRAILDKYGIQAVHWTYSGHDGFYVDPAAVVARVGAGLRPGVIVLLHDALADEGPALTPSYRAERDVTVAALPGIVARLKERALRAVTLTELLGKERKE